MEKELIKANLPHMVVWMAKEAVMEGVRACKEVEKATAYEEAKDTFNYGYARGHEFGLNVAAEVLWKLFTSMSIEIKEAIKKVAENHDGYCEYAEEYFDDFMDALEEVQQHPIRVRQVE